MAIEEKTHPDKLNCVLKEMAYLPEKTVMIGDTLMDMAMAKSAGIAIEVQHFRW